MTPQLQHVVCRGIRREVVAGELRSRATLGGAVINELEHVDALVSRSSGLAVVVAVLEMITEGIRGKAQGQARWFHTLKRFNGGRTGGGEENSGCGALKKSATVQGGVHGGSVSFLTPDGTKFPCADHASPSRVLNGLWCSRSCFSSVYSVWAVMATKVGAMWLLKLSRTIFLISACRWGLMVNQRSWPTSVNPPTEREPGTS